MKDSQCNCGGQKAGMLPEVRFTTFIMSLASSVLVGLGEVPDPDSGQIAKNLLLARHNIDVLEMLRQKTQGNLEKRESTMLNSLLYELQLKYVMACDQKDDKAAKQA